MISASFFRHIVRQVLVAGLVFGLIGGGLCPEVRGNEQFDEYQVKAVFLFNLANFIYWPEESYPSAESPFVIAILGDTPLTENLENIIRGESIGTHPILLQKPATIDEIGTPHLLFLARKFGDQAPAIFEKIPIAGTLTVSDVRGFAEKGGGITLAVESNRIALKLNLTATQDSGVRISSKLLRLAQVIRGSTP